ncbi:MAG: hypothetical protein K6D61_05230 [Prevotella sp.]|jgi:hypothetical protein|nr:hypothetical protein [Prevotella sp.]
MFNIDRRYIDAPQFEETLQSRIITIRSKNRNDPTLPKAEQFGISDEDFENYIDKKQDLMEWQKDMKRRGPLWLVLLFCIPPVLITWKNPDNDTLFWLSFLAGLVPCVLLWLLYKLVAKQREKRLYDQRCEQYIEALLAWEENKVES